MTDSYEFRQNVLAKGRLIGVTEPCAETKGMWWQVYVHEGQIVALGMSHLGGVAIGTDGCGTCLHYVCARCKKVADHTNGTDGDVMTWTDERPTEPGEYWVSIEPGKRGFNVPGRPTRPNRSVIPIVIEMDSVSFDPGMTVYFDQRGFGTSSERTGWIGKLDCGFFDGAKWSRRGTPADPFQEVTT